MLLKKTGKNYHYKEELHLKIRNLGKPICHYTVAMATSKLSYRQLSNQNVREG